MIQLFLKGGPVMWPMLVLSVVALSVVIERLLFLWEERKRRDPESVQKILDRVEHGHLEKAVEAGAQSHDPIARVLTHGLTHREVSLSNALLQAAGKELDRYNRGLVILDTSVTLGPLLGLLGTVMGMMKSFGIVGGAELAAQQRIITGGVAESLIAVSFGLGVAILAIIPLNYLGTRLERMRRQIEDASMYLELLVSKHMPETNRD